MPPALFGGDAVVEEVEANRLQMNPHRLCCRTPVTLFNSQDEGIEFGERSYVPGSENRIVAMINGQANATIADLSNKNILME